MAIAACNVCRLSGLNVGVVVAVSSYRWTEPVSGVWSDARRWTDAGTGAVAASAPGAASAVVLSGGQGGAPAAAVQGPGSSASLQVLGDVALRGSISAGVWVVGSEAAAASLELVGGAVLSGAAGTLLYGPVHVGGSGSRVTLTGALTLGGVRTGLSFASNMLKVDLGGAVQAGSLVLAAQGNGANGISVDAASSLEVGGVGGAAAGTLTVGSGRGVSGAGTIAAAGGIVDEGVIAAADGVLTLRSPVTGGGLLSIGAGATLFLSGTSGPSSTRVQFAGAGGTLMVAPRYSAAGPALTQEGVIGGFGPGQTIAYYGASALTGVSFSASAGGGALSLFSGGALLGVLPLSGSFAGSSFQVSPRGGDTYAVTLAEGGGGGGTAPGGTVTPDVYAWSAGGSGAWAAAANWRNVTRGGVAAVAPGANNVVTIAGPGSTYQSVTGPGNAASLTFIGNSVLSGAYAVGALVVGTAADGGALALGSGAVVAAGTVGVGSGLVQVGGSARLTASGALTIGGAQTPGFSANALVVDTGGVVSAAGVVLAAPGNGSNSVSVDGTGRLEVGISGEAAAGTLLVGAGRVLSGVGRVAAAGGIVNQGTIVAEGGTLTLVSPVSGGSLRIGAGATLFVDGTGGASTASVAFGGAGGVLQVAPLALGTGLTQQGVISGFAAGETISFFGARAATSVAYRPGAGGVGTLSLFSEGAALGSLTLAGDYTGKAFRVGGAGANLYSITVAVADRLFDEAYYLAQNPDVAAAGVDGYAHYMSVGWREGRNPDALFDSRYYLAVNADVRAAGVNPLAHYEANGWREGREPSLAFSGASYLAANADVRAAGIDPLAHYLVSGRDEGRAAVVNGPATGGGGAGGSLLVDEGYAVAQVATIRPGGLDVAAWFHQAGWRLGVNPNAWFDTSYYLTQNPDVRAAGIDPLAHFESSGWREGREPSLLFSDAKYLAAYPDVRAAGIDPLFHYVGFGRAEGRMAFLTGGAAAADPLVDAGFYDRQLGATLVPGGVAGAQQAAWSYDATGWRLGLNPDAWFDTRYYLSHNPDVAAAGINPLAHYEASGWREGRDASAGFSTGKYLAAYGDVRAAGINPLLHYLASGQAEGRRAFLV